jgi:8-oxo-dGTP pyrophosphatase MutT (NUDIX family)
LTSWIFTVCALFDFNFVSDFDLRISNLDLKMVPPRYASTVALVRSGDDGAIEVLLTRRPAAMRFLGGFYVFPGGTVHQNDYSREILARCRGLSGTAARKILGDRHAPEVAIGHWVAVFRELFEEVGILLCVRDAGDRIDSDEQTRRRIELKRQALVRKEIDFAAFLESENFFCDLSRGVYFDHWVTPEIYSMRFDTRFYIAALPANQAPLPQSEEVTHSLWIRPEEALARIDGRDFPILPPTTTVLQNLARLGSWERVRAEFELP